MKSDAVLVLYENALFAKGLVSILKRAKCFTVKNSPIQNGKLRGQVKSLRPKMVIVESDKPLVDASNALGELLKHRKEGCVIGINLNAEETIVCTGVRLAALIEGDLIQIIKMQMEAGVEYASL